MKKDVELMNRFELLNEVERLRSKDRTHALEAEVAQFAKKRSGPEMSRVG